jgi:hypothetical protein
MPAMGNSASGSRRWAALSIALPLIVLLGTEQARAGGAFVVEDAEVDKPGTCKVESWGSFADNRDMRGVTSPACGFNIFRPVELGLTYGRFRNDGEWGSELEFKGKTQLFESGKFSAAIQAGTAFDMLSEAGVIRCLSN